MIRESNLVTFGPGHDSTYNIAPAVAGKSILVKGYYIEASDETLEQHGGFRFVAVDANNNMYNLTDTVSVQLGVTINAPAHSEAIYFNYLNVEPGYSLAIVVDDGVDISGFVRFVYSD